MNIGRLVNKRVWKGDKYCIGHLYLNGEWIMDILEPPYRGLKSTTPVSEIMAIKKRYGKTAIPEGIYSVDMNCVSPRFGSKKIYQEICEGKLPRLVSVPGYSGVLFHIGNTVEDTEACQLTGWNKEKGKVLDSTVAFKKLVKLLKPFQLISYEVK